MAGSDGPDFGSAALSASFSEVALEEDALEAFDMDCVLSCDGAKAATSLSFSCRWRSHITLMNFKTCSLDHVSIAPGSPSVTEMAGDGGDEEGEYAR